MMEDIHSNDKMLRTPRPFPILLIQCMATIPFSTGLALLVIAIISNATLSLKNMIILGLVVIVLMVLSFLMFYMSRNRIPSVTFDRINCIINIIIGDRILQQYDLVSARRIISKRDLSNRRYMLIIEKLDGSLIHIFNEITFYGGSCWELFSEKLSALTGIPLTKEIWLEDYCGEPSLISNSRSV